MTRDNDPDPFWNKTWPALRANLHAAGIFAAAMTAIVRGRRAVSQLLGHGVLNSTLFDGDNPATQFLGRIRDRVAKETTHGRARSRRPRPGRRGA